MSESEQGEVRQPRAWILVGGQPIVIMGFEAHLARSAGQMSTAEINMALDDPSNPGPKFWSAGGLIPASLVATNGDSAKTTGTILTGFIEFADVDFGARTVTAHMVDYARLFADNRSDANWSNMTSSQIVQQLAAEHGLPAVTDPGSMAGHTFDDQNYSFLSDLESDWDVIQTLARKEGYIAYMSGNTLYFVDPGNTQGNVYPLQYTPPQPGSYESGNMVRLRCGHNFDLGQGVQYGVSSWKQYDNQAYSAMSGAGGYHAADRVPGQTMPQVQKLAASRARDLSMREYSIEVEMRGDVALQPTWMLSLSGTQSSFDMTYYIYTVEHRMNDDDGYTMEIVGYNSPPFDVGHNPSDTDALTPGQGTNPNQQIPVPGFNMITGNGTV